MQMHISSQSIGRCQYQQCKLQWALVGHSPVQHGDVSMRRSTLGANTASGPTFERWIWLVHYELLCFLALCRWPAGQTSLRNFHHIWVSAHSSTWLTLVSRKGADQTQISSCNRLQPAFPFSAIITINMKNKLRTPCMHTNIRQHQTASDTNSCTGSQPRMFSIAAALRLYFYIKDCMPT